VRGEFAALDDVVERALWEPFCPDGLVLLQRYREECMS
jgi:hypothetical protein